VQGAHRQSVLPQLVSAMIQLEPRLVESDFSLMVSEVLRREKRRCLVVLFTALEPAALSHGLLPVLGQLTAKHMVIIAAVGDPTVTAMARGRGTSEAVFAAAAAERALDDRRRITRQLRRHGVEVIDAPADVFASVVVDAYLELKAAGRL